MKKTSRNTFDHMIVGESRAIRDVISKAKQLAVRGTVTTLITGESGTGKELFARLIHAAGPHAHQPFVDINCGAIPESLLESELFGYEKGAFTGAENRKPGLFELANKGTIFLDEIGNTNLTFQIKLLKAVEQKRFRRIGGIDEVQITTRIIAATNVDLQKAVSSGKFREDLYYRLNVCEVKLPPLRERSDDSALIASHLLEHFRVQYDRQNLEFSEDALEAIRDYHWPGNVRQLKNSIERTVLQSNDSVITAEELALQGKRKDRSPKQPAVDTKTSRQDPPWTIPDEGISLEDVERKLILSALNKCSGNLSKAARLLHIKRGKLRYRLDKLCIDYSNELA
ncbi:MAG: sigma-54 interaction domain-containing protein [Calditrichia bacterium]